MPGNLSLVTTALPRNAYCKALPHSQRKQNRFSGSSGIKQFGHYQNHAASSRIRLAETGIWVKSYFDRWPMQELNLRDLKSRVNIHRIVGYGKKTVDNTTVLMKIERLRSQIHRLENVLEEPLHQIREMENTLQIRIREETTYREKSRVVNGERKLSEDDMRMFQGIQKEISSLRRQIRNIRKADAKLFTSLKKKGRVRKNH
ncbi:MAG: hypothetical protein DRI57_03950 [Deltaproteobacteria bacterium]|nr:MAG: hypothetical protein DRI57_03950 [Deltaproteobacteria bacterium]